MSLQPLAFTGISKYSADFQTIINRAVQIAAQPITTMQTEQADLVTRKQLLTNLNGTVAALATQVTALGEIGANKALAAKSSDSSKVAIVSTSASTPATYTISEITSTARNASATSSGFADGDTTAISTAGKVKLTFNGVSKTITFGAGENNLAGLRDKINDLDLGLTASVLTTGTGTNPYYLSLTADTSGSKPITLVDDPDAETPVNLLSTVDNGANAEFKINGASVSKSTNLINDVVPGLTFSIAGTTTGAGTVTLSLATDRDALATALESFATAYNAVVDQVDAQIGPAAGMLSGDFLVRNVQTELRGLTNYNGTEGSILSLSDLGLEAGEKDGKLTLQREKFDALTDTNIQDAFQFLGTTASGLGKLAENLTVLSDPITGLIRLQQDKYDGRDRDLQDQIAIVTDRVNQMQIATSQRLQMIDALLGSLASQQTIVDASIQSLNLVLYGKNDQ